MKHAELFEIIIDYDFIIIYNIFCVNYNMNKLFVELLAFLFLTNFLSLIVLNLRKYQTKHLSIYHMSFMGAIFILFFSFCVLIYKFPIKKAFNEYKNKMTPLLFMSFFMAGFLGIITWLIWIHLIKTKNMSKFVPVKQGIYIVFVFLSGIYLHKEKLSLNKILGLFFILLGIFFMGYNIDFKENMLVK